MTKRKWNIPKERVKEVMDEVDELDLPDGAYWAVVHDRLGINEWDTPNVYDYMAWYPDYFGLKL